MRFLWRYRFTPTVLQSNKRIGKECTERPLINGVVESTNGVVPLVEFLTPAETLGRSSRNQWKDRMTQPRVINPIQSQKARIDQETSRARRRTDEKRKGGKVTMARFESQRCRLIRDLSYFFLARFWLPQVKSVYHCDEVTSRGCAVTTCGRSSE